MEQLTSSPEQAVSTARPTAGHGGGPWGCVETFERNEVIGWVVGDDADFPARLELYVEDLLVTSTWAAEESAANTWGKACSFRFALRDVWQYCPKNSRLNVRLNGRPIPIAQKGIFKKAGRQGGKSPDELRERFAEGYIFSHSGRLQLSKKLDTEWQDTVIGLYRRLVGLVTDQFGYEPFVFYGSLLGAVREGGFIGHDMDFDCAYVSSESEPEAVAAEFARIGAALIAAGLNVEPRATALHVHDENNPRIRIDLFHTYFDAAGTLRLPFGHAGTVPVRREDWAGVDHGPMEGHQVALPFRPEKWLAYLYGENWRTPSPGFSWERERRGYDGASRLGAVDRDLLYWSNHYRHHVTDEPSDFATSLSGTITAATGRPSWPTTLLDLGCGDGRDSLWFATHGYRVTGLDRSPTAVDAAELARQRRAPTAEVGFLQVDLGDPERLGAVIDAARPSATGSVLFYLRFLLHAMPADVVDRLLTTLAAHALPGDVLAAEFRTDQDPTRLKVNKKVLRRFLPVTDVVAQLGDRYGWRVDHSSEAAGRSVRGTDDPVLGRVLATRTA